MTNSKTSTRVLEYTCTYLRMYPGKVHVYVRTYSSTHPKPAMDEEQFGGMASPSRAKVSPSPASGRTSCRFRDTTRCSSTGPGEPIIKKKGRKSFSQLMKMQCTYPPPQSDRAVSYDLHFRPSYLQLLPCGRAMEATQVSVLKRAAIVGTKGV